MSAALQTLLIFAVTVVMSGAAAWLLIRGLLGLDDCIHPAPSDDFDQHTDQALALLDEPFAVWGPADELALRRWQKEHQ